MNYGRYSHRYTAACCLAILMLLNMWQVHAIAEDDDEEYIPEEYYEAIQSNNTEEWPQGEAIQASAGVVMDLDNGVFLYSKNSDRQLYPASITKIMTCLIVLEQADLDSVITCSSIVYDIDEDASNTGLSEGEQMTVRQALYTLMLESANDTANALAEYVGGSISGFAAMMNERAQILGCTSTHFSNPSGLHADDHYTTAHDMALIAQAAYENEAFRTIVSTVEYEIPPTNIYEETRYLSNHHQMLKTDSEYYVSWCTGGKTGFTESAWNTLVTYGQKNGMNLVCVLLHGNGADQNYLETTDLLNYGFNNFIHIDSDRIIDQSTLAQAMHVDYLGNAALLTAPELKQNLMTVDGSIVTIPSEADIAIIKKEAEDISGSTQGGQNQIIDFIYNGWKVGQVSAAINQISLYMTYNWQTSVSTVTEEQAGSKEQELDEISDIVWADIDNFVNHISSVVSKTIADNSVVIIFSLGLIVIVFLILLLILLLRATRDYRIMKKNRAIRREAARREAEIEAKSTAEIERELRKAIEEERQQREAQEGKKDSGLRDLDLSKEGKGKKESDGRKR